jgi:hypothetical protein
VGLAPARGLRGLVRPLAAPCAARSRDPAPAPPLGALLLFLVPAVLLFPVKLAALWLMHRGQAGLGLLVIVVAKLVGTALVGRIYLLTQAQLMQYAWFARALGWWIATKARVKAALHRSALWRSLRGLRRRVRVLLRRLAR